MRISGRTAVVTGAASGIGLAMAKRFAAARMQVVLADVEKPWLRQAQRELAAGGASAAAVPRDVANAADVEALADAAASRFRHVDLVCNNAGVSGGSGPIWSTTENDWNWVLGVNVMGVVHGLQVFVPRMIDSGEPGHVVSTSSVSGLSTGPHGIYGVAKARGDQAVGGRLVLPAALGCAGLAFQSCAPASWRRTSTPRNDTARRTCGMRSTRPSKPNGATAGRRPGTGSSARACPRRRWRRQSCGGRGRSFLDHGARRPGEGRGRAPDDGDLGRSGPAAAWDNLWQRP